MEGEREIPFHASVIGADDYCVLYVAVLFDPF